MPVAKLVFQSREEWEAWILRFVPRILFDHPQFLLHPFRIYLVNSLEAAASLAAVVQETKFAKPKTLSIVSRQLSRTFTVEKPPNSHLLAISYVQNVVVVVARKVPCGLVADVTDVVSSSLFAKWAL